jgi:hypothetical protein
VRRKHSEEKAFETVSTLRGEFSVFKSNFAGFLGLFCCPEDTGSMFSETSINFRPQKVAFFIVTAAETSHLINHRQMNF